MKVIFLDIDGVVRPYNATDENAKSCLTCLRQLVAATGALLVISSSWRLTSWVGLMRLLATVGLDTSVIGGTPSSGMLDNFVVTAERPLEIRAWLAAHPDVTTWVALDDAVLKDIQQVKCESGVGLTSALTQQAIAILNGENR
jgi:hypothetical protein